MRRSRLWVLFLVSAYALACGSETTSDDSGAGTGAGGVDDGKLRPEPNGVHISEDEACTTMRGAIEAQAQRLNCTKTLQACPNFLRSKFVTQCAEYDEGSVQGCVDHWSSIFNGCEFLDDSDCLPTFYPEAAPAGCP